jgi:hypothetical protein
MNIKIMNTLLILLLSFLLLTGCSGGGLEEFHNVTISGHVEDFISGQPIEEAFVYIDSEFQDITNSNGSFQFKHLIKRKATLKIKKAGYFSEKHKITATSNGEIPLHDIR